MFYPEFRRQEQTRQIFLVKVSMSLTSCDGTMMERIMPAQLKKYGSASREGFSVISLLFCSDCQELENINDSKVELVLSVKYLYIENLKQKLTSVFWRNTSLFGYRDKSTLTELFGSLAKNCF